MIKALVIGTGSRAEAYMKHIVGKDLPIKIVAIAEIIKERRDYVGKKYKIPEEQRFETGEQAISKGGEYDIVIITTPDKTHHNLAISSLENGYNVLLEKPMATTAKECIDIVKAQQKSGKILAICHVLRYAPFFKEIKKITEEKELGKLQNVNLIEDVSYWHFAHSYVRGNWRKEEESSPIILAKSCHDLDILTWITESEADIVFSRGSLNYFKKENKPDNSSDKCIECPVLDCPYNSKRFYLNQEDGSLWPYDSISQEDPSEEGRKKSIATTRYGKCVFQSDNDVCDNQDVLIEFKNGVNANFSLRAGGAYSTRRITLNYEKGQITGDLSEGVITKTTYTGKKDEHENKEIRFESKGGHGGGDLIMLKEVIKLIENNNSEENITSAQRSLESHLIAFASEESRKSDEHGKPISMKEFKENLRSK